jgi:hypothetical protein
MNDALTDVADEADANAAALFSQAGVARSAREIKRARLLWSNCTSPGNEFAGVTQVMVIGISDRYLWVERPCNDY